LNAGERLDIEEIVVYLSGKELLVVNMPEGAVSYATLASRSGYKYFDFLEPLFDVSEPEENLLSVEVHKDAVGIRRDGGKRDAAVDGQRCEITPGLCEHR
jgi:hypothetical protein